VQAVWMNGACRNLLGELRLSAQHRLPYQFPDGYEFFTSPYLVTEACRQAGSNEVTVGFTAARVQGFGSDGTDTWVTWGSARVRTEIPVRAVERAVLPNWSGRVAAAAVRPQCPRAR
jgi:hypothetical protein